MKMIYTNRNGRNELSSCECGDVSGQGAYITYYLHIDDNGNILDGQNGEEMSKELTNWRKWLNTR